MATLLVTAILEGGPKLETVMEDLSVLQPKVPKVSLKQLQASFGSHAVVIQGDLPQKYFPRCYKHHPGKRICTCETFTQRAKCPHVYYVGALEGELDLDNLPTRKKPGRKRAGAGTSQEGNAKHQKTDVWLPQIHFKCIEKVTGKMPTCVCMQSSCRHRSRGQLQASQNRRLIAKSFEKCKAIFGRKACAPVFRIDWKVTPALQTVRLQIFLSTTGAIHAQRRRVAGLGGPVRLRRLFNGDSWSRLPKTKGDQVRR